MVRKKNIDPEEITSIRVRNKVLAYLRTAEKDNSEPNEKIIIRLVKLYRKMEREGE